MDAAICPLPAHAVCTGGSGLLTKLVDTLLQEPRTSPFRVFLASAVEGYLRGAPSIDRVFLMNKGLLVYCIKELRQAGEPPTRI